MNLDISKNIENVKNNIISACRRASRDPDEIRIIAASKYADFNILKEAYKFGINEFGENKADDLIIKRNLINEDVVWHFIGHLQSNKIKKVVPVVEYIHSIDSIETLKKVDSFASGILKKQKVLLEVNVSFEKSKFGLDPAECKEFIGQALKFKNIKICGLMTMAPLTDNIKTIREVFSGLKNIRNDMNNNFSGLEMKELSMGMTNDYEIAIEEGATMLRIGSAIFQ